MKIKTSELKSLIKECLREELGRKIPKKKVKESVEDDIHLKTLQDVRDFFGDEEVIKEDKLALKDALAKLKRYKKDYPEFVDDIAGFMDFLDDNGDFGAGDWTILTVLDLGAIWGKEALENNLRKYDVYNVSGDEYYIIDPRTNRAIYNFIISDQGVDRVIDGRTGKPVGTNDGFITLEDIPD